MTDRSVRCEVCGYVHTEVSSDGLFIGGQSPPGTPIEKFRYVVMIDHTSVPPPEAKP